MEININLIINDLDAIKEKLVEGYGEDFDEDDVREFLEERITARSKEPELFEVEGGDTDGWLVGNGEFERLIEELKEV